MSDYQDPVEMLALEMHDRLAAASKEYAELQAKLDAVQACATERRYPEDEQRTPINIHPHVKDELYAWLMAQAPSGEGYSEFIAKALVWRKYMQEMKP